MWDAFRPFYDRAVSFAGRKGLKRVMNGTDPILLSPRFRAVIEEYEPDVWQSLMSEIRPGDTFADVGTFIGLYALAVARRVGPSGLVVAFEPDPSNHSFTKEHIRLNALEERVELVNAAVSDTIETVPFSLQAESAHISLKQDEDTCLVDCITLDHHFAERRLDVLKIDVEGYEEKVLSGATSLLRDEHRAPRAIYIEVHPYAWTEVGTTSDSLLSLLESCNYRALNLDGKLIERITNYGEIIARRCDG